MLAVILVNSVELVCGQLSDSVPVGAKVQKITLQHIGQPAASDTLIRANIRLKQGDIYTLKSTDDDIHNLRNLWWYFY